MKRAFDDTEVPEIPPMSCFAALCDMKPAIYVTEGNIGEGTRCALLAVVELSVMGQL